MVAALARMALAVVVLAGGVATGPPHAPPPPARCLETLRAAGVRLTPWPLRATKMANGVVCEAPDGLAIRRGPALRYQPAARVNCAFALRLVRFEAIVDEEARRLLGWRRPHGRPARHLQLPPDGRLPGPRQRALIRQRHRHRRLPLANGRRVVVEQDWVPPTGRPPSRLPILRRLTRRLYDEKVFTVVLTPSYDGTTRTTSTSTARPTPSTGRDRVL